MTKPLDFITLTPQETAKLFAAGSGDAALVYLYMKATGDYRLNEAGEQLHMQEQTLAWAESLLKQLGLTETRVPEKRYESARAPVYTAEAVTAYAARDPSFSLLQGEISRRLGRILSPEDLKTLLSIRDYLKLPAEVITMVLTYCLQKTEYYNRANGKNRTVTMRMLERECYNWANQGINTLELASAYISENLKLLSPEAQVKKVMQLERPLVDSEREYIRSWLKMGFTPDAVRIAYERTLVNAGQLSWKYMNKILLNWNEKNLHTPEEIRTGDTRPAGKQAPQGGSAGGSGGSYTFSAEDLSAMAQLQKRRGGPKEES